MAVKTVAQMCAKALSVDIIRSDILSLCWLAITIVSSDTDGDIVTNYFRRKSKRYGLLSFLKSAQETVLPQRVKKGF